MDERRDEKLLFKYISRNEETYLKSHLEMCLDKFDVTTVFDRSGYSPLHFAAFKNFEKVCEVLC
jgi:ankyrin repeat protein